MKFATFMSTAAVFGAVVSVELQWKNGEQRTFDEMVTFGECLEVMYGVREESSWTPEQCSNARWAMTVRTIQADLEQYPEELYNALEHCRTADYYKEIEFCEEKLFPIWKDYYDIVNKD